MALDWDRLDSFDKANHFFIRFNIKKTFVSEHTALNRVTGILLFLLPLTLTAFRIEYTAPIVCTVATIAAVQEGYCLWKNK